MTGKKKLDPLVAVHLHKGVDVTPARVRAFGRAKYAVRLAVLAELRMLAKDQSSSIELSLIAVVLALIAFLTPQRSADPDVSVAWVAPLVATLIASIVIAPTVVTAGLRLGKRDRALVWLGAYEDEITRRAAKGK